VRAADASLGTSVVLAAVAALGAQGRHELVDRFPPVVRDGLGHAGEDVELGAVRHRVEFEQGAGSGRRLVRHPDSERFPVVAGFGP
jgi:hypothetical protein